MSIAVRVPVEKVLEDSRRASDVRERPENRTEQRVVTEASNALWAGLSSVTRDTESTQDGFTWPLSAWTHGCLQWSSYRHWWVQESKIIGLSSNGQRHRIPVVRSRSEIASVQERPGLKVLPTGLPRSVVKRSKFASVVYRPRSWAQMWQKTPGSGRDLLVRFFGMGRGVHERSTASWRRKPRGSSSRCAAIVDLVDTDLERAREGPHQRL